MSLLVIRYASKVFIPAVLGLFLLSRRIAELIANFMQLGASQMLRCYLPKNEKTEVQILYILAGLNVLFFSAVVFMIILMSALNFWANLAFPGYSSPQTLMFWTGMLAISSVLEYICSSILLAKGRVLACNFIEGAYTGFWMLLAIWLLQNRLTVINLTKIQMFTSCVISCVILFSFILRNSRSLSRASLAEYRSVLQESCAYSLPRSGIPFLDVALLLIGPWLLRHSPENAGYLIIAFFVLRSGRLVITPVSKMTSIYVTSLIGKKDKATLIKGMSLLFGGLTYLGFLSFSFLYPWAYTLLKIWLGDIKLANSVLGFAKILLFSLPLFVVYQGLKEQIEMVSKRPLNFYILFVAICTMVGVFYVAGIVFSPDASILYGYLFAFLVSAVLSILCVKDYLAPFRYFGYPRMLLVSGIVFLINMAFAERMSIEATYMNLFGLVGSFILSVTAIFIFLYCYMPSPFIREIALFTLPVRFRPFQSNQEPHS
jgi:hypothetical protein